MDFGAFRQSLAGAEPPAGLDPAVAGLWWDAKGDWGRAHECAQQEDTRAGCAVSAPYIRVRPARVRATASARDPRRPLAARARSKICRV